MKDNNNEDGYLSEEERKKILSELGERIDFIGGSAAFDPVKLYCPECGGSVYVMKRPWCPKCDKLFEFNECVKK